MMKKRSIAFLMAFCMIMMLMPFTMNVSAARPAIAGKTIRVEEGGFNITYPENLEIFTRDNQKHMMSNGVMADASNVFTKNPDLQIYLTNVKNDLWYEIHVTNSDGIPDFNVLDLHDAAVQQSLRESYEEMYKQNGYKLSDFSVYEQVETDFVKTDFSSDRFGVSYFTVYNGKMISILQGTRSEAKRTEGNPTHKNLVDSVDFTMPFVDVSWAEYYADPVVWAVKQNITTGKTETLFAPNENCTRAQMVTFLWRAYGEQNPSSAKNPFKDVSSDAYYYKAVLWAVEAGVTDGTSATTFSPDDTVTRGQTVTFMWRAELKPGTTATNPFSDVPSGEYYSRAVLWAVAKEITTGTSDTTFSPNDPCTRAHIVTFLYRDLK